MLFEQFYRPHVNKKELIGFLQKNDIDMYRTCPFCGKTIETMVLRREKVMTNLHSWLDIVDSKMPDTFSLQIIYKCQANLVAVYEKGATPEKLIDYGCGPGIKYRRVEFKGVYPHSEITR